MNKILVTILCLVATASFAQDRETISTQFTSYRLKQGDTSARVRQAEVRFNIPTAHVGPDPLLLSLGYGNTRIGTLPSFEGRNLHSISLTAALLHRVSAKKQFTFFVQTGVFSDLTDLSGEDVRTSAGMRYLYSASSSYKYGFGLAYSRQFFGNQILPFFEMGWQISPKLRLSGQIPVRPKLEYRLDEHSSIGTGIDGSAGSFRLSAKSDSSRYIRTTQWGGYFMVKRELGKYFSASISAGRYFKNSYKLYNDTDRSGWTLFTIPLGKKPDPVSELSGKSFFIQAGISYHLF